MRPVALTLSDSEVDDMRHVAERAQSVTYRCRAAAYTGWGEGDLIELDGPKIVTSQPWRDGDVWVFDAAPAHAIGTQAGTA